MNAISSSLMTSLFATFKPPTSLELLQKKRDSLCQELQDNINDSSKRKNIIKDLSEVNQQVLSTEFSEETARLEANQRLLDEEASKEKRRRDRVLYGKHEEDFVFNASIGKLLSANTKMSCSSGKQGSGFLVKPQPPIWEQDDTISSSSNKPQPWGPDEINDDVAQARKIGIEEAEASRMHKREILRKIEKEEATHIRQPKDYPEPIISVYAAHKRIRKGQFDKRV